MQSLDWNILSPAQRAAALARPEHRDAAVLRASAGVLIDQVRRGGDAAVSALTQRFDAVQLAGSRVSAAEFADAERRLAPAEVAAIERAIFNVRQFHAAQGAAPLRVQIAPGVLCERLSVPIRAVGLYVPAGTAPLPSTAIMLGVPALLAGCPVRVMCTPPAADGAVHPAILAAARRSGVEQVFKAGGVQAIAAMAYGTESIPKCDKIFGPGNAWVAAAKQLVAQDPHGAASDLPAGVSEVMIIADDSASARFAAADLLAQAEHSAEAQALLVSTSPALTELIAAEVGRQAPALLRAGILAQSLRHIRLLTVDSLQTAFDIANRYAPEHLLLQIRDARSHLASVTAAGAVFLGHWSPETLGDYCSGPNHTLPTHGHARAHSGLSLEDFQKRITVQELTPDGLRDLGPTAAVLAGIEGLDAHAAAVAIRLRALEGHAA